MRTERGVVIAMMVAGPLLVVACGRGHPLTPEERAALAASEAVTPLKGDSSPYRIIYHPPVDLTKRSGT